MASNKKLKVTPLKEDQVKDVVPLFKFLKQPYVYVERVFSKVNFIKTDLRNLLDVSTVSSIIKMKIFYENEDKLFEPTLDHYMCYKHWIKD